jgi:hypothetical protein
MKNIEYFIKDINKSHLMEYKSINYYKKLNDKDYKIMAEITKSVFFFLKNIYHIKFGNDIKLIIDTMTYPENFDFDNIMENQPCILDLLFITRSITLGQYDSRNSTITIFLKSHIGKSVSHLIYTICHEIAHIKYKDHKRKHTALTWKLKYLIFNCLENFNCIHSKYKYKPKKTDNFFR